MLREQFILPQPVKTRPVESSQAVRESRRDHQNDTDPRDFQSTLAATGKERQSGNVRAERPAKSEATQARSESKGINEDSQNAKPKEQAQERIEQAIDTQVNKHIDDPDLREKLKTALQSALERNNSDDSQQTSATVVQGEFQSKISELLAELDLESLNGSDVEALMNQLNDLLAGLQSEFNSNDDLAIQISLFANQTALTSSMASSNSQQDASKSSLNVEQIKAALVEITKVIFQQISAVTAEAEQSDAKGEGRKTAGFNGQLGQPLTEAGGNLVTTSQHAANASSNSELTQSTNSDVAATSKNSNLAWLNGILAQANSNKNVTNAQQTIVSTANAEPTNADLHNMAKLALENSQQLKLNDQQVQRLKALISLTESSSAPVDGKLSKQDKETYLELTKLLNNLAEQNNKTSAETSKPSILDGILKDKNNGMVGAINSAVNGTTNPSLTAINHPFKHATKAEFTSGQMQQVNVDSNVNLTNNTNLDVQDQAISGGKFKFADQIAVSNMSTLQPSSNLDLISKTQTVEVQGVQLDRTLQAPKLESISNVRHDAVVRENILFNKQELATAMQQQVGLMMARNLKSVDIRLDPPELGSMQIRLNIGAEAASVNFVVATQTAKDALEGSLPKLREMLEQQGMELTDSSVKKDNKGDAQSESDAENDGASEHLVGDNELAADTNGTQTEMVYKVDSPYKIDFYA